MGAGEVGLDKQAGGEGRAGSSRPGLLRGVQVGVTWPQRQLRSQGLMRVAGVRQSFSQHAVYQQRVPAASPAEQQRFPSSGPRTLPVVPVLPVSFESGALWEGPCSHFTDEDMEAQSAWQGNPCPWVRSWGSFSPRPRLAHWSMGLSQQPPQPLGPDPERRDAGRPPGEGATPAGRSGGAADPALLPEAHPRPAAQSRRAAAPPAPGEVPGRTARGLPE